MLERTFTKNLEDRQLELKCKNGIGGAERNRTADDGSEPLSSSTSMSSHVDSAMFGIFGLSREPILQRILQREMLGEKFSRPAFTFVVQSSASLSAAQISSLRFQ